MSEFVMNIVTAGVVVFIAMAVIGKMKEAWNKS